MEAVDSQGSLRAGTRPVRARAMCIWAGILVVALIAVFAGAPAAEPFVGWGCASHPQLWFRPYKCAIRDAELSTGWRTPFDQALSSVDWR